MILWLSLVRTPVVRLGINLDYLQKENQLILRQWQYPAQKKPVRDGLIWWVFTRSPISPIQADLYGRVQLGRTDTCSTTVRNNELNMYNNCYNYHYQYFKVTGHVGLFFLRFPIELPLSSLRRKAWYTFLRKVGSLGMVGGKQMILWLSLVRRPVVRLWIIILIQKTNQLILRK